MSQPRARQIVAGALVARAAMKALNVSAVDVCPWALREGIILHYLQTRLNESLALPLSPLNHVTGQLAAVQIIIIVELPLTLIGGAKFLGSRLGHREWAAIAGLTGGVIGLLACLDPQSGQ